MSTLLKSHEVLLNDTTSASGANKTEEEHMVYMR